MAAQARAAGLDVAVGDGDRAPRVARRRSSLGAITAIHVIEHLPRRRARALLPARARAAAARRAAGVRDRSTRTPPTRSRRSGSTPPTSTRSSPRSRWRSPTSPGFRRGFMWFPRGTRDAEARPLPPGRLRGGGRGRRLGVDGRRSHQAPHDLIACILGTAVVFLDGTVVNVALPAIRDDLDTGLAAQQWIVEAYLLTLGALLLVGGSLGDLFGRRKIFSLGLIGFGITSLLCALAPTAEVLIAARALQGVAGALLVPGLAGDHHRGLPARRARRGDRVVDGVGGHRGGDRAVRRRPARRPRCRGAGSSPSTCRSCWRRWRSCAPAVPESVDEESTHRIDYLGALLVALGLAGPVFALIEQPTYGFERPARVAAGPARPRAARVAFVLHEAALRPPDAAALDLPLAQLRGRQRRDAARLRRASARRRSSWSSSCSRWRATARSTAGVTLLPLTVIMFVLSRRFGALSDRIGPRR